MRFLVLALTTALAAGFAATTAPAAGRGLPSRPALRATGTVTALAAAGPNVAVAVNDPRSGSCVLRAADLLHGGAFRSLASPQQCQRSAGGSLARVDAIALGRKTMAITVLDSPSPHGDTLSLATGSIASKTALRAFGSPWGWSDSSAGVPAGQGPIGCAQTAVRGGGVIALVAGPNRLALDNFGGTVPACARAAGPAATTRVTLRDAGRSTLSLAGSWSLLATDGHRLLLAALDDNGVPTGQLSLRSLSGAALPTPQVPASAVRSATSGWLVPGAVVLRTGGQIQAWPTGKSSWTIAGMQGESATVANGRVLYVKGKTLRVRRIGDGRDRLLAALPAPRAKVAAGSFGLAVAVDKRGSAEVYRLPWRTIDAVLPA
jgi:hypothetical protein